MIVPIYSGRKQSTILKKEDYGDHPALLNNCANAAFSHVIYISPHRKKKELLSKGISPPDKSCPAHLLQCYDRDRLSSLKALDNENAI